MICQPGQRLVFIGDSITDCDRRGTAAPYGNGYVGLLRSWVTASHPELGLSWVNRGVSGDTVRDLAARWHTDAIAQRPDWLCVLIGINDVWRHFAGTASEAVPLAEYAATLRALLRDAVDATACRLLLAEPYLIEPDRTDPHRAMSDRYGELVGAVAAEFDAVLVPTQRAFDRVLAVSPAGLWSDDRVHPNQAGHAVLAQAYLGALGWRPPR